MSAMTLGEIAYREFIEGKQAPIVNGRMERQRIVNQRNGGIAVLVLVVLLAQFSARRALRIRFNRAERVGAEESEPEYADGKGGGWVTKTFCDWCESQVGAFSNEGGRMKSSLNVSGDWCEACVRAVFDFVHERKPKQPCEMCGLTRPVSEVRLVTRRNHGAILAIQSGISLLCRECQLKTPEE